MNEVLPDNGLISLPRRYEVRIIGNGMVELTRTSWRGRVTHSEVVEAKREAIYAAVAGMESK